MSRAEQKKPRERDGATIHFSGRIWGYGKPGSEGELLEKLQISQPRIARRIGLMASRPLWDQDLTCGDVEITFERGSIEFWGKLEVLPLGGGVSLLAKGAKSLYEAIEWTIRAAIEMEVSDANPDVMVHVWPSGIEIVHSPRKEDSEPSGFFSLPFVKILAAATTLNIALFIGGTVYFGVEVSSVRTISAEAQGEIHSSLETITSRLASMSDKVDALDEEFASYRADVAAARNEAVDSIQDTHRAATESVALVVESISGDSESSVRSQVSLLQIEASELSENLSRVQSAAIKAEDRMSAIDFPIGLSSAANALRWPVKTLLLGVPSLLLLAITILCTCVGRVHRRLSKLE